MKDEFHRITSSKVINHYDRKKIIILKKKYKRGIEISKQTKKKKKNYPGRMNKKKFEYNKPILRLYPD